MNPQSRAKRRWGEKKLRLIMKRSEKMMKPHHHKLESPAGMMAGFDLAVFAHLVAAGTVSREDYNRLIKCTAEALDIPFDALSAHCEFFLYVATQNASQGPSKTLVSGGV